MDVQPGCFRAADIEKYAQGAGVIPVARAPDGTVRLLLGRERYLPHWHGSCRWSGFEGSRKLHEDLDATAEREFVEEYRRFKISVSEFLRLPSTWPRKYF